MKRAASTPASVRLSRSTMLLGLLAVAACVKQVDPGQFQTQFPHDRDAWLSWRARETQVSPEEMASRDAALSASVPADYGADHLALEGAALWAQLCASCHGGDGSGSPAMQFDPAPRELGSFGMTMGFMMGGDEMRLGIHRKIRTGLSKEQTQPGAMPGFEEQLCNEQIWALVQHIESL